MLTYQIYQLLLSQCDPKKIFTHDQVIYSISKWHGGGGHSKRCMLLRTNYPWVFKSKNEIISHIDDYRLLVIPSLQIFGRPSIGKFKMVVLLDKFAQQSEYANHYVGPDERRRIRRLIFSNDEEALTKLLLKLSPEIRASLEERVSTTLQMIRPLFEIRMKSDVKFIKMLQGKNSIIRAAVTKKKLAMRAQVMLRPELEPGSVILPYVWAPFLNLHGPVDIIDISDPAPIDPARFITLPFYLLFKRDPAINGGSITAHNKVLFSRHEYIFLGQSDLDNKNKDFDGDTEIGIVCDRSEATTLEIGANMDMLNNARIYQQNRICFSEMHVLYMHQRRLPLTFPHRDLYEHIRMHETYSWLSEYYNRKLLDDFDAKYPHCRIRTYVEPTRTILKKFFAALTQLHSSAVTTQVYNYLTTQLLLLSNGQPSELADPVLPHDYPMEADVLCDSLIRICVSGARGSLESLFMIANRVHANDGTTEITPELKPLAPGFLQQADEANKQMANKSAQVQKAGHVFFKALIGYSTLSFTNNAVNYNNIKLLDDADKLLPSGLFIDSAIVGHLLFGNRIVDN